MRNCNSSLIPMSSVRERKERGKEGRGKRADRDSLMLIFSLFLYLELEQQEYIKEKIDWRFIEFKDNAV
jgi:hypothetical protein